MSLPTTGNLRLSQVAAEFGINLPARLSDLYGVQGVAGSGILRLSDFRGLSNDTNYRWVGIIEIQPVKAPNATTLYGYYKDSYGARSSYQNYNDFNSLTHNTGATSEYFDAVGSWGLNISEPIAMNLGDLLDARDVDRVEYHVYGGSAGNLSGRLQGTLMAGAKYGTEFVYRVSGPETGPLSNLSSIGDVFKYAADRNATLKLTTYIP